MVLRSISDASLLRCCSQLFYGSAKSHSASVRIRRTSENGCGHCPPGMVLRSISDASLLRCCSQLFYGLAKSHSVSVRIRNALGNGCGHCPPGMVLRSISDASLLRCCSQLFYGLAKSHSASVRIRSALGNGCGHCPPSAEGETPPAFKSPRAPVPAIEAPIQNSIREADTSLFIIISSPYITFYLNRTIMQYDRMRNPNRLRIRTLYPRMEQTT